jgi:hypothetical protein
MLDSRFAPALRMCEDAGMTCGRIIIGGRAGR